MHVVHVTRAEDIFTLCIKCLQIMINDTCNSHVVVIQVRCIGTNKKCMKDAFVPWINMSILLLFGIGHVFVSYSLYNFHKCELCYKCSKNL